jgi:formate dehydrogenase major subunit
LDLTRRQFLKLSALAPVAFGALFNPRKIAAQADALRLRIRYARETTTICPYCGVGCGMIVHSSNDSIINIEGDPDHPINEGALCSKGSALFQVANNDARLTKIKYRASGSTYWEDKSWNWVIDRITRRIKETRDAELSAVGGKVNRVKSIAALGGAALDNEECYLYSKFMRALGVVYIEHQARI